jgi:hypothetical protein
MKNCVSTTPSTRRFTLLDGMILVGSIALGLAPLRWRGDYGGDGVWEGLKWTVSNFAWNASYFDHVIPDIVFLVMPLTLGMLVLRLRKPRPRWRRLVRQPGFLASLALVLGWVVAGAMTLVDVFWSGISFDKTPTASDLWWYWMHDDFAIAGPLLAGFAVVVAWSTQFLVGRWCPEPSWIDRLGRIIGVCWIALALLAAYLRGRF